MASSTPSVDVEVRATLKFYARPGNWIKEIQHPDSPKVYSQEGHVIAADGGWRARRALKWQDDCTEFKDLP